VPINSNVTDYYSNNDWFILDLIITSRYSWWLLNAIPIPHLPSPSPIPLTIAIALHYYYYYLQLFVVGNPIMVPSHSIFFFPPTRPFLYMKEIKSSGRASHCVGLFDYHIIYHMMHLMYLFVFAYVCVVHADYILNSARICYESAVY
jgi:hypothetical protein